MYKIISPRVGTPGDEFTPLPGVSIEALLAGGFIIEIGSEKPTTKPRKTDKVETTEVSK